MTPDLRTLIAHVAATYGLRSDLLIAQVDVESGGDPFAFRFESAYFDHYIRDHQTAAGFAYGPLAACSFGLLQILLETAIEQGFSGPPEQLFVPRVGLAWGAKYLATLVTRADGNLDRALAAYNGGERGNLTPPFRNQAYVDRVRAAVSA